MRAVQEANRVPWNSKLRGCDLVRLRVIDIHLGVSIRLRTTIAQQKTGELMEPTREALASWLRNRGLRGGDWLFPSRSRPGDHLITRQYGRLLDYWVALIGLDPAAYGTHSLRRTKVALVYKRTGNLRACQLLLGTRSWRALSGTSGSRWTTLWFSPSRSTSKETTAALSRRDQRRTSASHP